MVFLLIQIYYHQLIFCKGKEEECSFPTEQDLFHRLICHALLFNRNINLLLDVSRYTHIYCLSLLLHNFTVCVCHFPCSNDELCPSDLLLLNIPLREQMQLKLVFLGKVEKTSVVVL
jgi:hypothetical protein